MNSEIFFNLSNEQISIIIFDKDSKKEISNKIFNLSNLSTNNMSIEDGINHVLKNQIIYIEEIINTSINSINLMLEEKNSLSIKASVKKDYDKNPIQKNQIEYLIQDLKQQILKNNSDLKILHIIVDNFIVDEQHFDVIPLEKKCNELVIEVRFICCKKNHIDFLKNIFKKYQINFKRIICTKYAKSLVVSDPYNILEAGLRVVNGFNSKEVIVFPKKPSKLGFFERIFHLFS